MRLASKLPSRARARRVVTTASPMRRYEDLLGRCGFRAIAGVDEAGRGASAGPLVVSAVVLEQGEDIAGLNDSKLMTANARDKVYEVIITAARAVSVVVIGVAEVDASGVHAANLSGMRRAVARLSVQPDFVLTDGFGLAGSGSSGLGVWKGDRVLACVAAAGVVAKVTRDRIMRRLAIEFPEYALEQHKGYMTEHHRRMLERHGPSEVHRRSFEPVRLAEAGTAQRCGSETAGQPAGSRLISSASLTFPGPATGRRSAAGGSG